jgi:hypothetical protein
MMFVTTSDMYESRASDHVEASSVACGFYVRAGVVWDFAIFVYCMFYLFVLFISIEIFLHSHFLTFIFVSDSFA